MKTLAVFPLILLLSGTLFSQKDVKSFNKAKKASTVEAYEEFLGKYPESALKEEAIDSIYKITGRNISARAYFDFYNKYKDNKNSKSALTNSFIIRYFMSNDSADLAEIQQDFSGMGYDDYIGAKKTLIEAVKNDQLQNQTLIIVDQRDGRSGLQIKYLDKEYKIAAKFSDDVFNDKLRSLNIDLSQIAYVEVHYSNRSAFTQIIHLLEARTYFGKCSELFPNLKGIKLSGFVNASNEAMIFGLGGALFTPMNTYKAKNNRIISVFL